MNPHLHAALLHAHTAELARSATRHHAAPRRERARSAFRAGRLPRTLGVLRLARDA